VTDGVPVLLASPPRGEQADQAAYFDDWADAEHEIERPVGTPAFHGRLLVEKFQRGVEAIRGLLPGASALAVCGGSGLDAELLSRAGATVVTADISPGAARRALERASRHGFPIVSVVGDAEALPFADRSVDVVYVHDGLHHVERPLRAVAEMARVAKVAVSVNEPARALATEAAALAGLALRREEAGNPVRRLTVDEVARSLRAAGFRVVRARRYAMLYRHEAGSVSRLLSRRRLRPLAAGALSALDPIGARIGNKLTVQAVREGHES
jgi:ubiquinone/menaquinone biosynthesis C-methylase UbiE